MSLNVFSDMSDKPISITASSLLGGNNTVIMADPRKGKSYTAAKFCEELCRIGVPFIIIDPEGEYYSLREKFSVLVVGVGREENCDASVGSEHAEILVQQFLESRIPLIVDLSGADVEEEEIHDFLSEFMNQLIRKEASKRVPCLVVIDEADEFIPERGHKTRGKDYAQFSKLVKKGGKRGIGTIIITHRPTWVAKDLLAKCQNWILMNQRYKKDLQRIEDLTRIPLRTLMKLNDRRVGEALLYGAITKDKTVFAKCLQRDTTHIGTTPDIQPKFVKRPELEGVLEGFRKSLGELTRRRARERSDVERLEGQIKDQNKTIEAQKKDINQLKTARMAAKMVEEGRAPEKVFDSVPREEYDQLNNLVLELKDKLSNVRVGVNISPSTPFWIDEYGTFHSDLPWLTRLIDMNRITAIIIKHLMENGGASAEDISLNYGFHIRTIRGRLRDLLKKGVITRSDRTPYKFALRAV